MGGIWKGGGGGGMGLPRLCRGELEAPTEQPDLVISHKEMKLVSLPFESEEV